MDRKIIGIGMPNEADIMSFQAVDQFMTEYELIKYLTRRSKELKK